MNRILILLLAAGLVVSSTLWLRTRSELNTLKVAMAAIPQDPVISPEKPLVTAEISKSQPVHPAPDIPVFTNEPANRVEPLMVKTVAVGEAESPPMTEALASALDRFDTAMDREFNRLEQREQKSNDETEFTTIQRIKEKLTELDELYRRADNATEPEERANIRREMQATMGSIIGLSRVDRNERLGKLATQIGYTDPEAINLFLQEVDRIYHETHMDWTKLFNRSPPEDGPPRSQ